MGPRAGKGIDVRGRESRDGQSESAELDHCLLPAYAIGILRRIYHTELTRIQTSPWLALFDGSK